MNGKSLAIVVASVGLLGAAVVYAGSGGGSYYSDPNPSPNVQSYRSFYKDTASLRDDLAEKEFELQQEYDKANPNPDRISVLRNQIVDLQTRIEKNANRHGLGGMHHGGMWGGGYYGYGGCGCW